MSSTIDAPLEWVETVGELRLPPEPDRRLQEWSDCPKRTAMLKDLGLRRVAYDLRQEHVPTFEQEILDYELHCVGICWASMKIGPTTC